MATTAATLVVKVVSDTKQATSGLDTVSKSTSTWKDKLGQASKVATVGLVALGGAAIYAGKAAAEDAQSQAVLANTMTKSAGATASQVKATEDFISKTALATGVADDQLRPAMGNLVRATGDVEKSQKAMTIALDIAAATGKDVGAVSAAMAKGYGGNEAALNKLLPSVTKVADKTGDFDAVMKAAAKTTEGAAAASANTAAGEMARMQVAMDEATESLGAALLPAMAVFARVLAQVAGFIMNNSRAFQIIIGVVAAFAAAIVVLNYALKAYAVITKVVGIAMKATWLASPIGLVVLAIIAVVAIVVVLYKKFAWFRNFVNAVWAGIKTGTRAAVAVIKVVWKVLWTVLKTYVKVYITAFRIAFDVIKAVVKAVISWIKPAWKAIGDVVRTVWRAVSDAVKAYVRAWVDVFRAVFDWIRDAVRAVAAVIKDVWQGVKDAVRTVVDGIKEAWRGGVDAVKSAVSGLGKILSAPFNAAKGVVDDLVGIIGDLVNALTNIDWPSPPSWLSKVPGLGSIMSMPAPVVPTPRVGRFGAPRVGARGVTTVGGGGGLTINVTGALDPEATARQIRRILDGHDRRVGLRA